MDTDLRTLSVPVVLMHPGAFIQFSPEFCFGFVHVHVHVHVPVWLLLSLWLLPQRRITSMSSPALMQPLVRVILNPRLFLKGLRDEYITRALSPRVRRAPVDMPPPPTPQVETDAVAPPAAPKGGLLSRLSLALGISSSDGHTVSGRTASDGDDVATARSFTTMVVHRWQHITAALRHLRQAHVEWSKWFHVRPCAPCAFCMCAVCISCEAGRVTSAILVSGMCLCVPSAPFPRKSLQNCSRSCRVGAFAFGARRLELRV